MKKGLKLLRGEVIGAYPAWRDPRAGACSNLHHPVALASIGSLWEIRLGGRKGNQLALSAWPVVDRGTKNAPSGRPIVLLAL